MNNDSSPLLQVKGLTVGYSLPRRTWYAPKQQLIALDDVSFDLASGEVLGVVGESGCGKSTLARALMGLVSPIQGSISFSGMSRLAKQEPTSRPSSIQMIFQDPLASLNPRMTAGEVIAEPLLISPRKFTTQSIQGRVQSMMALVGLSTAHINRYPHEFSGGQCQRIGIARALITEPKVVICDEPVSALDVSIQAQIINLLMDLQGELKLSLLFIAHDLSVIRHISNRVMIIYLGKIVEIGECDEIYRNPRHPYTRALMQAVPVPDPVVERNKSIQPLAGDIASPIDLPRGCYFQNRCARAHELCKSEYPLLGQVDGVAMKVACHSHWNDTGCG